ncbi:hypothetical protein ACHAWO_001089 [Cyclotella atomus]|uniref:Bestrophin homolog n=1 Tax=Cyclotella atomus TaxID=382360 RepID=A0ABD3PIN4_9STRA
MHNYPTMNPCNSSQETNHSHDSYKNMCTRCASHRTSIENSLTSIIDADEHLQMPDLITAPDITEKQLSTAKIRRVRFTRLHMNILALLFPLIRISQCLLCSAFPSPNVRASRLASRHHLKYGHQWSTKHEHSASADTDEQIEPLADIEPKPLSIVARLLRRPKNNTQSSDSDVNNDDRIAVNKFWQRSVKELKTEVSSMRYSPHHLDGPKRNESKFIPSPTSRSKQINQLNKQRKSTTSSLTSMLRVSKVQSFAASTTALQMVLSTPESIIEQVSTEKLLDILIDESVRTSSREPIMMQFNPRRGWIWRQWRGTVFSETWKSGLLNMALATSVVFLYKLYPSLKDLLQGFSILWGQLLSVTTFTLTFFLNQSYGLWRKCYDYSRRLQGRLNDLGMTLAAHATRVSPSSPDIPSTYTPQSKQALELVSRYVRVFNLLTYASFTRSHRPILTPRGMRRLVERGILTHKEREILIDAEIPATQRHNAVLVWLIRLFEEGRQTGIFEGGYGFEEQFMEKCHVIRAQYGAIGDELQGRMPLAYAHIVQVLLDVVLWMYPFMALSTGMAWYIGVVGTGLLTMFYQGLFDLAKQFLDPYDNENYGKGEDPLVIDTLIAETNAGSVRWLNSFQQQPWSRQLLKDGEMYDSLLPLRGYSVEELMEKKAQEEAEKEEHDRFLREKRLKEEKAERKRAEDMLKENFASYVQNRSASFVERSNGIATLSPSAEKAMPSNMMNKTLLEISGGKVVSSSSLLTSSDVVENAATDERNVGVEELNVTKLDEPLKIYTLGDGTLVDPGESIPMTRSEPEFYVEQLFDDIEEDQKARREVESASRGTEVAPAAADTLLQSSAIGDKTPNFQEKITPVDRYLNSLSENSKRSEGARSLYNANDEKEDTSTPFKIEWWDEIGPDGQEVRLSQMLADEDWSYLNDEDENKTMGYEEFTRKATDLIEQTENEIAETREVLYSSPGRQAEYDAKEKSTSSALPRRKVSVEERKPAYDQTKLDAISQLWGAPPEVLGRTMMGEDEEEPRTINEGMDFANIYALWGKPITSKEASEDDTDVTMTPIDGIQQLWGATLVDPKSSASDEKKSAQNLVAGSAYNAFPGLEWWDYVSEDGKEIRLSMMLADEVYEEEIDREIEKEPMTVEQFVMETENMIQRVEDERKETKAILAAPPGADAPSEFDETDTDEDLALPSENIFDAVAASEEFEKMLQTLSQSDEVDANAEGGSNDDIDDIAVLEMDVDDNVIETVSSVSRNATEQDLY